MLDHHATNPGFGDVYYRRRSRSRRAGSWRMVLIEALGVALTVEMATWLYIAIVTDSGRFGYESTRSETMLAAAACLRAGIDLDKITREIYRTRSEGRTRLMGLVLSGLEMNAEKTMCWARAHAGDVCRSGCSPPGQRGHRQLSAGNTTTWSSPASQRSSRKTEPKFSLRCEAGAGCRRAGGRADRRRRTCARGWRYAERCRWSRRWNAC